MFTVYLDKTHFASSTVSLMCHVLLHLEVVKSENDNTIFRVTGVMVGKIAGDIRFGKFLILIRPFLILG